MIEEFFLLQLISLKIIKKYLLLQLIFFFKLLLYYKKKLLTRNQPDSKHSKVDRAAIVHVSLCFITDNSQLSTKFSEKEDPNVPEMVLKTKQVDECR